MDKLLYIIFIIQLAACSSKKNLLTTDNNICCVTINNDTVTNIGVNFEYDELILIDTTWYLPFRYGRNNLKLLYVEDRLIKIAPSNVFIGKNNFVQERRIKTWMDWNLEIGQYLDDGYHNGVNVLISKKIVDLNKNQKDTVYTFQTYQDLVLIKNDSTKEIQQEHFDYNYEALRDFMNKNSEKKIRPQYRFEEQCYYQISKKRGIISSTYCNDTSSYIFCNSSIDYSNFNRFLNTVSKEKSKQRDFFSKARIKKYSNIENVYINSILVDTISFLISQNHYYNFFVGIAPKRIETEYPINLSTVTGIILPEYGFVRMENGKFWAIGRMTYEMRFSKFKEYEQLIFDFKAKKGTTWQVQKHKLFGGEITYIGKRDKTTYQYRIKPNESNGFPNLVGFEVNEDWGFTRFDFRNDDGEIVSYDMIKD